MTIEEGVVENKNDQKNILVGIQMNGNSLELLNWVLATVAKPGDHVVVVHVCRASGRSPLYAIFFCKNYQFNRQLLEENNLFLSGPHEEENSSAKHGSLDGYLTAYEGLCDVKKVSNFSIFYAICSSP